MNQHNFCDVARSVVGARISQIQYQVFLFEDDPPVVISLIMTREGDHSLVVRCASDGESIALDYEVPEVANLGDLGRIELLDAASFDPAGMKTFKGQIIDRITFQHRKNALKSLRIECDNREAFLSNVGDTLTFDEVRFKQMVFEDGWGNLISAPFSSND